MGQEPHPELTTMHDTRDHDQFAIRLEKGMSVYRLVQLRIPNHVFYGGCLGHFFDSKSEIWHT